jgi:hypothetical protein
MRRTQQWEHSDTQDHTKTHNYLQESRKLELKEIYESSVIASLEKKLKFIEEKIANVVDSTKAIYAAL